MPTGFRGFKNSGVCTPMRDRTNAAMKTAVILTLFILNMAFPGAILAEDTGSFRFAAGYAFLSKVDDIKDSYKHFLRASAKDRKVYNASLGLTFHPYYQFKNGLRAGAGAGPLILLIGDARHVQVPLNAFVGYSFFPDAAFSGYFKCGMAYHAASGDFYSTSEPGFCAGIGIEFSNPRPVHMGFEIMHDASKIVLDRPTPGAAHEKIKTGELSFFLYADF